MDDVLGEFEQLVLLAVLRLDDEAYGSLRSGMARALKPWGERALWVEYERPRASANGALELRAHRVIEGELKTRVLASGAPRPTLLRLHEETPWQLH